MSNQQENADVTGRLWRFAECEFDELSRQLKQRGQVVDLEAKPLDILHQLLLHAGEVITKDELLESVWPEVVVVEGSLTTAVSKLRKALEDEEQAIIVTVPRVGYRLGVPVQVRAVSVPASPDLGLKTGDLVPGRQQWVLTERLDASPASDVWIAEHSKTLERRVFKFAADGVRLKGLKREVTLARLLKDSLGERPDFVRVLEWNFEQAPYYLESEFGGADLNRWAEQEGGLKNIPVPTRLAAFRSVARSVAAAHKIGVLHKDLKPANILIASREDGGWQTKVADFGSGTVTDPSRLGNLGITNLGFTAGDSADALTGTLMYIAPEVLAGQTPTALADVYSLGVVLYQLAVGDFRRPISPGWEGEVTDPLLREDIAAAAAGDPQKRLPTVASLLDRLENVERRNAERRELESARQRALVAERSLARTQARRPWAIAAGLSLLVGLVASLLLYRNALAERDRANRQTGIAASMNRFLSGDLLGRGDPFQSGKTAETLADAIRAASPKIDLQFPDAPEVAARLHHAIARAFDNRTDFKNARPEYDRAAELFAKAGPSEAVIVHLQRAAMEARTYEDGSLNKAKAILASQEAVLPKLNPPPADLPIWHASAKAMIALIGNDAKTASEQFQAAVDAARKSPQFDRTARLTLEQRLAFTQIRLGNGPRAEQLFRALIAAFTELEGPESPNVLRVRLNLAQAYMIQNKSMEAVAETRAIYPAYVARLGEDHELSMQVLTTQAQSEGSLGLWEDAIRDDLKIHNLAVKKQGPKSFFAIATQSDAALAQCRAGKLAEGAANALEAYNLSAEAFGPRAGLTGGVGHTLASCWIAQGKLEPAWNVLLNIDTNAVAQLAGDKNWSANVDLLQAAISYRKGDMETARKHLQVATPVMSRPETEEYQKRELATLTAALGGTR